MKFCAYITEYFRIKHKNFTQDALRFHISVVHCVGFTFSGHSVHANKNAGASKVSKTSVNVKSYAKIASLQLL